MTTGIRDTAAAVFGTGPITDPPFEGEDDSGEEYGPFDTTEPVKPPSPLQLIEEAKKAARFALEQHVEALPLEDRLRALLNLTVNSKGERYLTLYLQVDGNFKLQLNTGSAGPIVHASIDHAAAESLVREIDLSRAAIEKAQAGVDNARARLARIGVEP